MHIYKLIYMYIHTFWGRSKVLAMQPSSLQLEVYSLFFSLSPTVSLSLSLSLCLCFCVSPSLTLAVPSSLSLSLSFFPPTDPLQTNTGPSSGEL